MMNLKWFHEMRTSLLLVVTNSSAEMFIFTMSVKSFAFFNQQTHGALLSAVSISRETKRYFFLSYAHS